MQLPANLRISKSHRSLQMDDPDQLESTAIIYAVLLAAAASSMLSGTQEFRDDNKSPTPQSRLENWICALCGFLIASVIQLIHSCCVADLGGTSLRAGGTIHQHTRTERRERHIRGKKSFGDEMADTSAAGEIGSNARSLPREREHCLNPHTSRETPALESPRLRLDSGLISKRRCLGLKKW